MFNRSPEERLSAWAEFRTSVNCSDAALADVVDFWKSAPFITFNHKIDPYHAKSWPTPWEIIIENRYDDFTKALMIGWTLKLTKKYADSKIELRTLVDNKKPAIYNVCCIEDQWVLNYSDEGPVPMSELPDTLSVENLVELSAQR